MPLAFLFLPSFKPLESHSGSRFLNPCFLSFLFILQYLSLTNGLKQYCGDLTNAKN
nr:MAG TPA: hypothetical protein [Caudoviricetes sp.]